MIIIIIIFDNGSINSHNFDSHDSNRLLKIQIM